jgi:hypothetical protein
VKLVRTLSDDLQRAIRMRQIYQQLVDLRRPRQHHTPATDLSPRTGGLLPNNSSVTEVSVGAARNHDLAADVGNTA